MFSHFLLTKRKRKKKFKTKRKETRNNSKISSLKENSGNFLEFRSTKASLSTTDYTDDVKEHVTRAQPIGSLVSPSPRNSAKKTTEKLNNAVSHHQSNAQTNCKLTRHANAI